jgi:hypothetical protein
VSDRNSASARVRPTVPAVVAVILNGIGNWLLELVIGYWNW